MKENTLKDNSEERNKLLKETSESTEGIMIVLGFIWIILLAIDLTNGLSKPLQILTVVIWVAFILDFLLELAIAPNKKDYLKNNLLVMFSLFVPALRVFRIFRAFRVLKTFRAIRSVSLVRIVTSLNTGLRTLKESLNKRGLTYVIILTAFVILVGSSGIYYFENPEALKENGVNLTPNSAGIRSYGDALWWTSMILTTIGSEYWPKTPEGRILTLLISVYAFAILGYITGVIASFLIGKNSKV